MNCEEIREQLVETARMRELSSDLRKIVFGHTAECADCRKRLEAEQGLTRGLAVLSESMATAPARLEFAISRELRVIPMRRRPNGLRMYAGAAAAVAAAIGLVALFVGERSPGPRPVPVTMAPVIAHRQPRSVEPQFEDAGKRVRAAAVAAPAIARAGKPKGGAEWANFVQLPNAAELSPDEPAEMVRVEMPAEGLRSLGLALNSQNFDSQNYEDRVEADVLVGPDGTPRAIRIAN